VLKPGGQLLIADFAPHEVEQLRQEHAHRWLGFADDAVDIWLRRAGFAPGGSQHLPGQPLTVTIWSARRTGIVAASQTTMVPAGEDAR
jgi:hypothetical protein